MNCLHLVKALVVLLTIAVLPLSALADNATPTSSETANRGIHRKVLTAVTHDESKTLELYGASHALLVGVSRYTVWPQLNSIGGELDEVDRALTSSGFNVERLTDPDSKALKNGITDFINNYGYDPENRLLIYFSGHGHSIGERGFLLPVDIPLPENRQEFRRKALPMTQILAWAKDIDAKHVLFVFDSCFSGTVFQSKSLPEDRERYIRSATAKPVRQFITAGSANEEVPAKSTFTPAFVSAIRGAGDLNQDGYITGSELGVHLSQLVPQFVDQTPQYGKIQDYGLSLGDFVFFTGKENNTERTDATTEETLAQSGNYSLDTIEVMVWQSAEKGDSNAEYQAYLERYPEGFFAQIARARLNNTDAEALTTASSQVNKGRRQFLEPEMVLIESGSFLMGSDKGDEKEQPVQFVTIESFEIGKYEVSFAEFDQFTAANAIENISDSGWGRGRRPVINVTWEMAKEYTRWLSSVSGKRYRLPVEAEWEYAARAGSLDDYSFGKNPEMLCRYANIAQKNEICTDAFRFTAEVGKFEPNPWGLHDMHGNVWEWTEDCWHTNYQGAPVNGRAWVSTGDCQQRVVRGGAWYSGPSQLRSSQRNKNRAISGSDSIGFRIVRMLDE
ncbi:MAG: SUMF1/EgtB/PvdO family nonheme iron enzyme [Granulosicoccus sp.]